MSEDSSSDSSSASDSSDTADTTHTSDSVDPVEASDTTNDVDPPEESDVPAPPAIPEEGDPLEHIVDDVEPRQEAHAWAYMEMKRGRTGEDVHADLVARGWEWDDAEGLVESARKAPGAVEAAAGVAPMHRMRGGIIGSFVKVIVGVVNAITGTNEAAGDDIRAADRIRRGLCAKCGFDLQGSTEPCPNCGTTPPAKA